MSPKDLTHLESGSKAKNSHSVDPALMKAAQGMEALICKLYDDRDAADHSKKRDGFRISCYRNLSQSFRY